MQTKFFSVNQQLFAAPKTWLITGVAGFIGSNLLEFLLGLNQRVVGLDNFSTGFQRNLDDVFLRHPASMMGNFSLIEGDIGELDVCKQACAGVDYVLHHAALGSVPRSIDDPRAANDANVNGFLNMLIASKDEQVKSFVYASSSAVYGDHPGLEKTEDMAGALLSPYAVTKYVNELYAKVFALNYGFKTIGLRYFNVFGPRQDPNGSYAAVIPKWIAAMLEGAPVYINGTGETTRDFCFIENIIQANILAAVASNDAQDEVYNVALNESVTLNQLFATLVDSFQRNQVSYALQPIHQDFRKGDILHSQADITKISSQLGYSPQYFLQAGIDKTLSWYMGSNGQ